MSISLPDRKIILTPNLWHKGLSYLKNGVIAKTYTSKWWNWYSDWPPEYRIPKYCNGNCNSMAGEAAYKIWVEAQRTNRHSMRIEDKYFLGILRKKAGLPDINVVPVTTIANMNKDYNGYTRCIHISDANYFKNAVLG